MDKNENKDTARPARAIYRNQFSATTILAWGAFGALLYVGHLAFIPVALALLFALVLSGPVEALHRYHVPRALSATLIMIVVLTALAGVVDLMWPPAQAWFKSAPQTVATVKHRLAPAAKFIAHLEDLAQSAGAIGADTKPRAVAAAAPAPPPTVGAPVLILDATRELVVSIVTFAIITLFLLTGGPPMLARMTSAFVDRLNAGHVVAIIEQVRKEVGRFYVATALINLGLGCATAAAMMACGMPTPYLWGILAAVLNFIPYAGSATTLAVITLVALVTFDGVGHVLAVAGSYVGLAAIEGQIVQPLFVGRRLDVNPLLIFLGLWFGGLFWGVAGIVLATPALVALKVVAEHAADGKAILEFLGPNDQRPERERVVGKLLRPVIDATAGGAPHMTHKSRVSQVS
jgi:predicted PurR-regulated permease PerM